MRRLPAFLLLIVTALAVWWGLRPAPPPVPAPLPEAPKPVAAPERPAPVAPPMVEDDPDPVLNDDNQWLHEHTEPEPFVVLDGSTVVRCEVVFPQGHYAEGRAEVFTSSGKRGFGRVREGTFEAIVDTTATLDVGLPFFEPVSVELVEVGDGTYTCVDALVFEPYDGQIAVEVVGGAEGASAIWVEGCTDGGGYAPLNSDRQTSWYAPLGRCEVRAGQQHQNLVWYTDWVEVEVTELTHVTLELPDWKPAGIGFSLEMEDDAVLVLNVLPGTPGERAGLAAGDRIVAVDGEAVRGMSQEDFLSWALGPQGSEVVLTVEQGGETSELPIVRDYIEQVRRTPTGRRYESARQMAPGVVPE